MDASQFLPHTPGQLVEISTPRGKDWAFIPNELRVPVEFDPALWPLLVEAHTALGTLNGIGQTLAEPRLLLQPLQNREAITSSRIEGTFVTPQQYLLFEMDPTESSKSTSRAADWHEVHNYNLALIKGLTLLEEIPICMRLMREMHSVLMGGVRGKDKAPGEMRKCQVQIGHNGRFIPPPVGELDRLTSDLERYINAVDVTLDPLVRCFIVHYQFETIHPFMDGNGRIGRAILALMVHKWLGHSKPWLYMSAYFDKYKDEYVDNLLAVSTRGEWTTWIAFCLRGVVRQAEDSIRRCHAFNRLKKEYHARVTTPTPRTHQIVEGLFIDPFVQVAKLAATLEVTYPTAKADLDVLQKAGILDVLPDVKPKTLYASEVFKVAYSEQFDATS